MATIAAKATKALRVDHSMRAMDAMLSYGDHQQVIGGIFENVHSMEVRLSIYLVLLLRLVWCE